MYLSSQKMTLNRKGQSRNKAVTANMNQQRSSGKLSRPKAYMTYVKPFRMFLLTDAWLKLHLASPAERHQSSSFFVDQKSGHKTLSVTCQMYTSKFEMPISICVRGSRLYFSSDCHLLSLHKSCIASSIANV